MDTQQLSICYSYFMEGGRVSGDNENTTIIECEEALDVSLLIDFKALLQQALDQNQSILIDAAKLEHIDAAALQLLQSFIHKADNVSIEIRWQNPSQPLFHAAELVGLKDSLHLAE